MGITNKQLMDGMNAQFESLNKTLTDGFAAMIEALKASQAPAQEAVVAKATKTDAKSSVKATSYEVVTNTLGTKDLMVFTIDYVSSKARYAIDIKAKALNGKKMTPDEKKSLKGLPIDKYTSVWVFPSKKALNEFVKAQKEYKKEA